MSAFPTRRTVLIAIPSLLLATGVAGAAWMMHVPADLDLSLRKATEAGRYVAELAPVEEPVSVGPMHSWIVTLEAPDGSPVEGAAFGIDGGMPKHGHALPTQPAVTSSLGDGHYLIEGVRFNMSGWWELKLGIDGPAGADAVTFNLVL